MKDGSKQKKPLHRSIRCSDEEIVAVLDGLDAEPPVAAAELRSQERFSFRRTACVVHLQQPGEAETVAHQVISRGLSAGGMSFLYGGFVHRGSKCVVQLVSTHGAWENVAGTVASCRHVQGFIHEIGVQFGREIDVGQFCPDAVKTRVLFAEDDLSIVRLVTLHLSKLNTELTHVVDGQAAVDQARENIFDVILMDMEMPVLDGFEATRELREKGYVGKIIASTALTAPADRERCLQAGCDGYLSKPYSREDLSALLKSLQEEPLFSSMADSPAMIELIASFCDELPSKLRAVEEAYATEDMGKLEALSRSLKGEAGSYGFEPITDAAAEIEKAVRKETPNKELKPIVGELTKLCLMARASARRDQ